MQNQNEEAAIEIAILFEKVFAARTIAISGCLKRAVELGYSISRNSSEVDIAKHVFECRLTLQRSNVLLESEIFFQKGKVVLEAWRPDVTMYRDGRYRQMTLRISHDGTRIVNTRDYFLQSLVKG